MPRGKTTPKTEETEDALPKAGQVFVNGLYVKEGAEGPLVGALLAVRVAARREAVLVTVAVQGSPDESFEIPNKDLVADKVDLGGWTYIGGGTPLAEVLSKVS